MAKETAKSLRQALKGGILPGGGAALWHCRDKLKDALDASTDSEARAAHHIIIQALEEPLRAICHSAGLDGGTIAKLDGAPSGHGIDVHSASIANMLQAGIIDVAPVTKAALQASVHSAALALTIDVLLHHKNPPQTYEP